MRRAARLIVARITPPTSSGSAIPAPVFGIVWPSTLELLEGAGAVVEPSVGDADALGEAEPDPEGTMPGPAEPEGEVEPDGAAEPDGLADVCALVRGAAVAADDINISKPVINDNAARTARTRGDELRTEPPFCIVYCLPNVLPPMHEIGV